MVATAIAVGVGAVPALGAVPVVTTATPLRAPIAGLQDDRVLTDPAARVRTMADAGAALIRVDLRWDLVAPSRPTAAADPADPAYRWGQYDAVVAAARANRVEVLFTVYGTPDWARDPGVPFDGRYANWSIRPASAADFGGFAEAAARRYAPLGVNKWEGWNEPNIALFLRPQYVRQGGAWVADSPRVYSALQSAFYAAVKRVDADATVAGAVTAPAGDRCPDCPVDAAPLRVTPDDFIAGLAASGRRPPMDVVSHHPYPLTGPRERTPPGRTYVDLYNLRVLVDAIDRSYLAGKRLWLSEYGFATKSVPAYPIFFSSSKQASHIVDAYRRLVGTPRVTLAVYYLLQDHQEWASGVLTATGAKKPGYQALSLPFTQRTPGVVRAGRPTTVIGQVRAVRAATTVQIERKVGPRWVSLKRVRTSGTGSFRIVVTPRVTVQLRARWTGTTRAGVAASRVSPAITIVVR